MNKKLLIIAACLMFTGCVPNPPVESAVGGFNVVRIDKCQYLLKVTGSRQFFTHKGNCDNPIHVYSVHIEDKK